MSSISSFYTFVWNKRVETDATEVFVSVNDIVGFESLELKTGKSLKLVERRNESTYICDIRCLSNCERRWTINNSWE